MKNNSELQADVQNAIKWEPLLHAAEIGVTAKDGVVSLTGVVDSYAKKMEAEDAAKKVIDTLFDEFNLLYQKDTFLTNRLTTYIEKDYATRTHDGTNMTPYQQDILTITQKHFFKCYYI